MKYYLSAFFIGIITALAALVLEFSILILFFPEINIGTGQNFSDLFIPAVFVEEIIKFLLLLKIAKNYNFRSIFPASIAFGIGFSLAEISLNIYDAGAPVQNIPALAYIALTHLATCSMFGYVLAKKAKITGYAFTWLTALILHLFFNLAILRQDIGYQSAVVILLLIFASVAIKFLFFPPKNLSLPNREL